MGELQGNYIENSKDFPNGVEKNNGLNQYDSFGAMKIKDNSLFTNNFLIGLKDIFNKGIKNTEIKIGNNNFIIDNDGIIHGNGFEVKYAEEYSYMRVRLEGFKGYPINIDINKGTIYIMDAKNLQQTSIELLGILKNIGVLQESIPYITDGKIEKLSNENKNILDFIEKNNSTDLPFASTEQLDINKSINVLQQGAIIINSPIEGQSLYTFGAGPCLILSIYDKDTGKIGLAHIDATIKKDKIISFLSYFSDDIDIKIISGEKVTASNVLSAINQIGLEDKISFMNIDLDGQRDDSVAITIQNGEPEILYGYNPNIKLSDIDEKKLELIGLTQGGNLSIDIK